MVVALRFDGETRRAEVLSGWPVATVYSTGDIPTATTFVSLSKRTTTMARRSERKLFIDFETRSAVDLKKEGLAKYAAHSSTDIVCTAYAFNDDSVKIAIFAALPAEVLLFVEMGGHVVIHNANFELALWNEVGHKRYGWPKLEVEQCDCTLSRAYAMSLPGGLEHVSKAVGITAEKDMAGNRLMLKMSKPRGGSGTTDNPYTWWYEPDQVQRLHDYCKQDVVVTQQLDKRLLALTDQERRVWEMDQRINQRGFHVDVESATRAAAVVEHEQDRLNSEIRSLTGNAVATFNAHSQLKAWVGEQVNTKPIESVDKASVVALLADPTIPVVVRRVLEIRQEAAKSSTAKLKAFVDKAGEGDRVRDAFKYHVASTGRWASWGLQVHNFPRGGEENFAWDDLDYFFEALNEHNVEESTSCLTILFGSPMKAVSQYLRGFISAAPGKTLMVADFSMIEAKVLAWLASEQKAMEVFNRGEDIYKTAAADIYGCPVSGVDKPKRQVGKVAILALGYQGGVKAFGAMGKNYGVRIGKDVAQDLWLRAPKERQDRAQWGWDQRGKKSGIEKAEWIGCELIKLAWREANPNIVQLWRDVEAAAIKAVTYPGMDLPPVRIYGENSYLAFKQKGSFLFCRLPSGRCLVYPYPEIADTKTPWDEIKPMLKYKMEDSTTHVFQRWTAYGGLLVENITQAVARDLLAEAMLRIEAKGGQIVLHVHDECVIETADDRPETLHAFERIVSEVPTWAEGLPVSAEAFCAKRYRK